MPNAFAERDWKYIKSIHDEVLCALCDRINRECKAILDSREGTAHARYLRLYKHLEISDGVIADCFNDLKRSNLALKVCSMKMHGLLKPEHLENLSTESQKYIRVAEQVLRKK
jgi:hypothetical protein